MSLTSVFQRKDKGPAAVSRRKAAEQVLAAEDILSRDQEILNTYIARQEGARAALKRLTEEKGRAVSEKDSILRQYAQGVVPEDALQAARSRLLDIERALTDTQDLLDALSEVAAEANKALSDSQVALTESRRSLWLQIKADLAEDLRQDAIKTLLGNLLIATREISPFYPNDLRDGLKALGFSNAEIEAFGRPSQVEALEKASIKKFLTEQ